MCAKVRIVACADDFYHPWATFTPCLLLAGTCDLLLCLYVVVVTCITTVYVLVCTLMLVPMFDLWLCELSFQIGNWNISFDFWVLREYSSKVFL